MRSTLILLFTLILSINAIAQIEQIVEKQINFSISGTLADSKTNKPISYANIYNKTSERGTLSNYKGQYQFDGLQLNDTIIISYVGYQSKQIIIDKSYINQKLTLSKKTEVIDPFTVMGSDNYLYELVANTKSTQDNTIATAKTYYVLKSAINEQQVELVECYFNGDFKGYDISELNLKNGRIALAERDNRYYLSTESSKAIYKHKLFIENKLFPPSPFELDLETLKKRYKLRLASTHINDLSHTVYAIDFDPFDKSYHAFRGRVWIDIENNMISKVDLRIKKADQHPFEQFGDIKKIISVDLQLSKTFEFVENKPRVQTIDFEYQIEYVTNRSYIIKSNTNAVIHAYNYNAEFDLPEFEYTNTSYRDYNQISASPYNKIFWDNINEFKMGSVSDEQEKFIAKNAHKNGEFIIPENGVFSTGIYKSPYLTWKRGRRLFDYASAVEEIENREEFKSLKFQFITQIYMDINVINDTLYYTTQTIYDPFKSFFLPQSKIEHVAYMNMYFDITEINRRNLDESLKMVRSVDDAYKVYNVMSKEYKAILKQFDEDTDYGNNEAGMIKWNAYIKQKLDIDNVKYFKLFRHEKVDHYPANYRDNERQLLFQERYKTINKPNDLD